jgi:phosphoketolase
LPVTQIHRPARLATRAASFRYGGRHHPGIPGGFIPFYPGDFIGIRSYPAMIHKLTYRRHNHDNIHVRGFRDEGTTTTPFDMVVLNNLDRFQLALDAIRRIPRLSDQVEKATARYWTSMERHKLYISEHGDDMPEVRDWRWSA